MIDDYEIIYSEYPLYLMIGKVVGPIQENNEIKYLVFDSVDKNKKELKKIQLTLGWN